MSMMDREEAVSSEISSASSTSAAAPPPAIQQRLPREVPAMVRLSLRLGGALGIVGWALFGFGMVFFWVFAMNSGVQSLWQFGGQLETARGQVTHSEKTSFSVGGSRRNHRPGSPVFANAYVFRTPDGTEHRGISYATNRSLSRGETVEVEYPSGRPGVSRIIGMRTGPVGAWAALLALLPAAGLFLIALACRRGGRYSNLLQNGRLAWARRISKEPTNMQVNKRPVYRLTFEFAAENRRSYQVTASTNDTRELEDEPHELVLYDPFNPAFAVVADSLPAGVRVDERGQVYQKKSFILWLLLPTATLVGHGTYFFTAYLG